MISAHLAEREAEGGAAAMLALAHKIQELDLLLAPDLQEQVLFLEDIDGVPPMSERALRAVAHAGSWRAQRDAWLAARVEDS